MSLATGLQCHFLGRFNFQATTPPSLSAASKSDLNRSLFEIPKFSCCPLQKTWNFEEMDDQEGADLSFEKAYDLEQTPRSSGGP